MKVLALVASQRKLGNSEILAKEMLSALPDEINKEMIRLTDLDIKGCRACYACLMGEGCVIEDDLDFLLNKIKEADKIVISTPCYFLGEHTILKMIGDRMLSVLKRRKEFSGKNCVITISYGVGGWEGYAAEAVYNFASSLHLDIVGRLIVNAANPGEAAKPEILQKAKDLSKCLLDGGECFEATNILACSECHSSQLQLSEDGTVHCSMCGMTGIIQQQDSKYSIIQKGQGYNRFSEEGLLEHAKTLDCIKEKYISKRKELKAIRDKYAKYDWWVKPTQDK